MAAEKAAEIKEVATITLPVYVYEAQEVRHERREKRLIIAVIINEKGIDVYYNEFTNYFTIARNKDIIYEFYDGDTIDTAITQIVSTIQKY